MLNIRVRSSDLWVKISTSQGMTSDLQVMKPNVHVTSSNIRATNLDPQVANSKVRVKWFKARFRKIKIKSWSNETTSQIVNIRVKSENSRFKI